MFGFFKKKGGEIPEEQQRQQRGAQEGQTRQDAAEVPQEFRALGQDFLPEDPGRHRGQRLRRRAQPGGEAVDRLHRPDRLDGGGQP